MKKYFEFSFSCLIMIVFLSSLTNANADEQVGQPKEFLERFYTTASVGPVWLNNPKWQYGGDADLSSPLVSFRGSSVGVETNVTGGVKAADSFFGLGQNARVEVAGKFIRSDAEGSNFIPAEAIPTLSLPTLDGRNLSPISNEPDGDSLTSAYEYDHEQNDINVILKVDCPVNNTPIVISPYTGFAYSSLEESYTYTGNVFPTISTINITEKVDTDYLGGVIGAIFSVDLGKGWRLYGDGSVHLYNAESDYSGAQVFGGSLATVAPPSSSAEDDIDTFAHRLEITTGFAWTPLSWFTISAEGGARYNSFVPRIRHNEPPFVATPDGIAESHSTDYFVRGVFKIAV